MKEYLPIIERLFYAIAFLFLGWFAKSSTYKPTYLKNDIEVIHDTVFLSKIETKEKIINNYITRLDSVKLTIIDTLIDSVNCKQKDVVIALQDTIIEKTFVLVDTLKSDNHELFKSNINLDKQVRKDQRNKAILGGVIIIISSVLSAVLI